MTPSPALEEDRATRVAAGAASELAVRAPSICGSPEHFANRIATVAERDRQGGIEQ